MSKLPTQAEIVIIGGGIIGCSLAYHLTKMGKKDVLLLERKQLTSGTTWHAAGLIRGVLYTKNLTQLAQYSLGLYPQLEKETGQATGLKQVGSISIATNAERWEEIRRSASAARAFGAEMEEISAKKAQEMWPLMQIEDVVGAIHFPQDGQVNPADTTMALAKGARMGGATILEGIKVTDVITKDGRAVGVRTDQGDVKAEVVVNCAGMWAREVGKWAGVDVPLQAAEHFYIVTEAMDDLPKNLPVLRNMDAGAYFKEDAGKLLVGGFALNAKPWALDGIPEEFCFDEIAGDMDHFMPVIEAAMARVPRLAETGIRKFFNGPESFTPDQRYLLGPAPNLQNFYVAAGFNSIGIQSGGGVGMALAHWIVEGHPPMDLYDVDISRMMPHQNHKPYLKTRVSEALGLTYAMHWPYRQFETARNLRHTALYSRLKEAGACFGEVAGWERPNWFANPGQEPKYEYSFGRQNWFANAAAEVKATREAVGLFEQSTMAKFLVQGPDALHEMQRICAADMDVANGRSVYTQWLNDRGGIEADLTVLRIADEKFMVITAAATATHDMAWLKNNMTAGAKVYVDDVTSAWAVLGVMGPKSRDVVASLTPDDLTNAGFPFGASKEITLGAITVRATRISYMGELGWELYVPTEWAVALFDMLVEAGKPHGMKLCGMHAMDALRIEKAYRHWGHDITGEDTPIEAGLAFAVAFDKKVPFIGREALLKQKAEPVLKKRLLQFLLTDPEPMMYHNEAIFRDGVMVGTTSSANYGFHLGGAVALGYAVNEAGVTADYVASGTWEIEIGLKRYPAKASIKPLYDPTSARMKV
ncbi:MAG: FAD-dependent oxidoreductase [Rhodobacteraceae bacterium]|nr:FAD-dependent oxidoreductase [Paracoccaceae bacterium]